MLANQTIFAQNFPADIFGVWTVGRQLNACNWDITGDTLSGGVAEFALHNLSEDQTIDTTQLILSNLFWSYKYLRF